MLLGAADDIGHVVQEVSQHPQLPLQHTGRIYCPQTGHPVREAADISPWNMMAARSQALSCSELQALCLGLPALDLLLGCDTSPRNHSQEGGDGARGSDTWVVTALGLWETSYTPPSACGD